MKMEPFFLKEKSFPLHVTKQTAVTMWLPPSTGDLQFQEPRGCRVGLLQWIFATCPHHEWYSMFEDDFPCPEVGYGYVTSLKGNHFEGCLCVFCVCGACACDTCDKDFSVCFDQVLDSTRYHFKT